MFKRATTFTAIGSMACLALASIGCRQERPPHASTPLATLPVTMPTTRHTPADLPATEPSHDAPPRQPVY
jgi:hypothetical protein